jgi:hypothetical protein
MPAFPFAYVRAHARSRLLGLGAPSLAEDGDAWEGCGRGYDGRRFRAGRGCSGSG